MISIQFPIERQTTETAKQTKEPGSLELNLPVSAACQPCAQQHTDTFWGDREGVPVSPHCLQPFPKLHHRELAAAHTPACTGHVPCLSHPCVPLSRWHSSTRAPVGTFDASVHLHQAPDDGLPVVPLPDVHFSGEVAVAGLRVHQKHGHTRLGGTIQTLEENLCL